MSAEGATGDGAERQENGRPDYLASFRLIKANLKGAGPQLVASIILATISVFFELVPIWVVYRLVSAAIDGSATLDFFLIHAGIALGAILLSFLTLGTALTQSHIAAFNVLYRLRLMIARHLAKLPLGYFSGRRSGDAKKLIIDEPERLELIVAHGLPEGVSALANWLAISIWLFIVDWRMAIAAIIVTPASFVLLGVAMTKASVRALDYQKAGERMNASIVEYLAGMPVVKVFNRTGDSFAETSDAVKAYARIETEWGRDYIPLGGSFYALVLTNVCFILPIGAWLMASGSLALPTLLFFVILGAHYSQPMLKLFNQYHTLAHVSMGSTLIAEVLKTPAQSDTGERIALPNHDIVFKDVRFGYAGHDVLHGVSFAAKQGEVTVLVGPSGSGKSTIASLIPRFWDVGSGSITLGGVDIRQIGLDQLMDTVGFVFQNTFLFADTVGANIRFGKPSASQDEVEAAAKAARAHEFIMALPQGYDTVIGERGGTLSGGERQRIAIARAMLKDAPVIVLDEATAFADPDNEAAIQEAIGALTKGRTLIVVAHRLHTVAQAGQILVVDGGRIAEAGKHDALLKKKGLYARLWADYTDAQSIVLRPTSEQKTEAAQ